MKQQESSLESAPIYARAHWPLSARRKRTLRVILGSKATVCFKKRCTTSQVLEQSLPRVAQRDKESRWNGLVRQREEVLSSVSKIPSSSLYPEMAAGWKQGRDNKWVMRKGHMGAEKGTGRPARKGEPDRGKNLPGWVFARGVRASRGSEKRQRRPVFRRG
jgi:hypothetical protein